MRRREMDNQKTVHGLFVGINEYLYESPRLNLSGCVNDVDLISKLIGERFHVSEENMLVLKNADATRANIIRGFQEHLSKAEEGDTVVFYFSGHGSTEKSDRKLWSFSQDYRNETLVCHDSRVDGVHDFSDKELRYFIYELSKKKVEIVTIIDSCHAGDVTRYISPKHAETETKKLNIRQVPSTGGVRSLDSYHFYNTVNIGKDWLKAGMPEGGHIAISSCRPDQLSKEIFTSAYDMNGIFTWYFCESFRYIEGSPSYQNLVDAASQRIISGIDGKVSSSARHQSPQIVTVANGPSIYKSFLSDSIQPIRYAVSQEGGKWWLHAGYPQGINLGAELKLSDAKSTRIIVEKVSLNPLLQASELTIVDEDQTHLMQDQYSAEMVNPNIDRLPVSFEGDADSIQKLKDTFDVSGARFYLEVHKNAEYMLKAEKKNIKFLRQSEIRGAELPLVLHPQEVGGVRRTDDGKIVPTSREEVVLELAKHMSAWENENQRVYSLREEIIPIDLVELSISQKDLISGDFKEISVQDRTFEVYYQKDSNKGGFEEPRVRVTVSLNDRLKGIWPNDRDIYFSLLLLNPVQGKVQTIANNEVLRFHDYLKEDGASHIAQEAKTFWSSGPATLSVHDVLLDNKIYQTSDFFKLVISNNEVDLSKSQLTDLINKQKSLMSIPRCWNEPKDDFSLPSYRTVSFIVNTIKPSRPKIISGSEKIELSETVSLLKHKGLRGKTAKLESLSDELNVLQINTPPEPTKLVTDEEPLILSVDLSKEPRDLGNIWVFSIEDGVEIPVGFTRVEEDSGKPKMEVVINKLPSTTTSTNKSLGGSLLFYLKKEISQKLELDHEIGRLAIPIFDSVGSLEVSKYDKSLINLKIQVKKAKKIVLFIHGLFGDTNEMAGVINQEVEGELLGSGYLPLTFDYENLSTSIEQTANQLKEKLVEIGLTGGHGKELVIVAHSTGGLIARWMLETETNPLTASKLIMLGTPNGGTPIYNIKKILFFTVTIAKNFKDYIKGYERLETLISFLPTINITIGDSFDELSKNSKAMQYLSNGVDPNIPYYLIAGDTTGLHIEDSQEASKLRRLIDQLIKQSWLGITEGMTDYIFNESNDLLVSHSSMQQLPAGRKHEAVMYLVDSDHLSYFSNRQVIKTLSSLLRG